MLVLKNTFAGSVSTLTFLAVLTVTFLAALSFLAGGCTAAGEEEEGSSYKSVPGGGLLSALFEGLGLWHRFYLSDSRQEQTLFRQVQVVR